MIILGVLIVAMTIEIGLNIGLQNSLEGREFADLLGAEIGGFIEYQSVAITQDIG